MPEQYTTKSGDTWDYIAYLLMGNERYTHLLMAANVQHLETVVFSAGELVQIPQIEEKSVSDKLPPWRRADRTAAQD